MLRNLYNYKYLIWLFVALSISIYLLFACTQQMPSTRDSRVPAESPAPVTQGGIAYLVRADSGSQIWRMDYEGQNAEPLVTDRLYKKSIRWSPSGNVLAYIAKNDVENTWSLWSVNADGYNKQQLTEYYPFIIYDWLPNGVLQIQEVITFTHQPLDENAVMHYYFLDTVSGVITETQQPYAADSYVDFVESPDRNRIAVFKPTSPYLSIVEGDNEIHVYELPEGYHGPEALAWSHNGEVLAFSVPLNGNSQSLRMGLFTVHADGTKLTKITDRLDQAELVNIGPISWSPDNKWIAYIASTGEKTNLLCAVELSTSNEKCWGQYWSGGVKPYWLPNSRSIVIITNKTRTHDILAFPIDSESFVNFTHNEMIEYELDIR